jgi:hypothetical protein
MKAFLSLFITIGLIAVIQLFASESKTSKKQSSPSRREIVAVRNTPANEEKMRTYAGSAKTYIRQKKFNPDFCFLIDMSLPSGQPRFFIYDLGKDSVLQAGLVAHGNCYQEWLEGRKYSNTVGSGCTSLGRYKIGIPYTGMWGYSYKLHGLDSSNNKAFERTVVLHSHRCVPATATESEICQSNGCPTVAPEFLTRLKTMINGSGKPVLLWIYE